MDNALPDDYRHWQSTAVDLSTDGRTAIVVTWVQVYLYVRRPGESCAEAFERQPGFLDFSDNIEAEAVTLSQMAMRFSGRWKVKAQQYFASTANKTPVTMI